MKSRPCSRDGCDRPVWGGKLCASHAMQMRQRIGRAARRFRPSKPLSAQVSKEQRDELYAMQGGHCPHCGRTMAREGAHVHHRKQTSLGGTNDTANLMLTPPLCHADIHDNHGRSQALGHIVASWDEPSRVEILPLSAWRVA